MPEPLFLMFLLRFQVVEKDPIGRVLPKSARIAFRMGTIDPGGSSVAEGERREQPRGDTGEREERSRTEEDPDPYDRRFGIDDPVLFTA